MSPAEHDALACRACAAPISLEADACAACGAPIPRDPAVRARLTRHRARARRAMNRLRAMVMPRVATAYTPWWVVPAAIGWLLGLPVALAVAMLTPLCLGLTLFGDGDLTGGCCAPLSFAMGFGALGLAGWGGLRGFTGVVARLRERAREVVRAVDGTVPTRCPGCGGHARLVAVGDAVDTTCPWCGATGLPGPDFEAAAEDLCRRALADAADASRRAMSRAAIRHGRPSPLRGFAFAPGETVLEGEVDGFRVLAYQDLVGGRVFEHVDVVAPLALEAECFLARAAAADEARRAMELWDHPLPTRELPAPPGWRAWSEAEALPEALVAALPGFGPGEALLVDPAGISAWRGTGRLSTAWRYVVQRHRAVAALARALSDKP